MSTTDKPRRERTLSIAGMTPAHADGVAPAPVQDMRRVAGSTPDALAVSAGGSTPDPAPVQRGMSDIASLHASNKGQTPLGISDMIANRPDWETDLVTITVRVRRTYAEALRMQTNLTKRAQSAIVDDALGLVLNPQLVDMVRGKLY